MKIRVEFKEVDNKEDLPSSDIDLTLKLQLNYIQADSCAVAPVVKKVLYINPNGGEYKGSSSITTIQGNPEDELILEIPTRDGYIFDGWYTEEDGGTQIYNNTRLELIESQNLYAHWKLPTYSVNIVNSGGGTVSPTHLSIEYSGTNIFKVKPNSGYYLSEVSCSNGYTTNAQVGANQTEEQTITISNNNMSGTSRCIVTFAINAITYITSLNNNNLAYDGTEDNNLRYIGSNPNNYVRFNGELWRIIGVMNNITDENGKTESHIKIIRNEPLIGGGASWDSKRRGVGSSLSDYGSNDWTDSKLMLTLNEMAYWKREDGSCFWSLTTSSKCYFSSSGLTTDAKEMISKAVWNLGAGAGSVSNDIENPFEIYTRERGTITYSNGTITRPSTWIGYVGLMYPSDYGFAVGGLDRSACLNLGLGKYDSSFGDCYTSDWLKSNVRNNGEWTLTSSVWGANPFYGTHVYTLRNSGGISKSTAYTPANGYGVRPVVYLKSEILITGGTGANSNPFIIKLP